MMKGQIAGLMRQAQQMQENMKKAQDAIGGLFRGAVRALVHGNHDWELGAARRFPWCLAGQAIWT